MPVNKLLKPWSISTTVRNPELLRGFLSALSEMEGEVWNRENQIWFQIILTQKNWYHAYESKCLRGINDEKYIDLALRFDEISTVEAKHLFFGSGHVDPTRGGRFAVSELRKLGFASISQGDRIVRVTPSGRVLLNAKNDWGNILLRFMVKWQLPNPLERAYPASRGYRIKPFVGTLHLIEQANLLSEDQGLECSGLSLDEFDSFVPTLIDWERIEDVAKRVVDIRKACRELVGAEQEAKRKRLTECYLRDFKTRRLRYNGEHIRRCFRMTRFLRYSDDRRFVDLEPFRSVEIEALLQSDNARPLVFR